MQDTTVSVEKVTANLVAGDCEETAPGPQTDLQPIYHAITARPNEVPVPFAAPKHSLPLSQPTYKALVSRPADFAGFFAPPHCERRAAATYFAMKAHP